MDGSAWAKLYLTFYSNLNVSRLYAVCSCHVLHGDDVSMRKIAKKISRLLMRTLGGRMGFLLHTLIAGMRPTLSPQNLCFGGDWNDSACRVAEPGMGGACKVVRCWYFVLARCDANIFCHPICSLRCEMWGLIHGVKNENWQPSHAKNGMFVSLSKCVFCAFHWWCQK